MPWPLILGQNLGIAGALCRSWRLGKAHDDGLWEIIDPLEFEFDPLFDDGWRPGSGEQAPTADPNSCGMMAAVPNNNQGKTR